MKRAGFAVVLLSLASAMAAVPASANTLYSHAGPYSSPYSYLVGGYFINGGQGKGIGDSFPFSQNATVTEVDFAEPVVTGVTPANLDWSMSTGSTGPFSGYLATGPGAAMSGSYPGNTFGGNYDIYSELFSVSGLSLSPDTYWLELQNAVTAGSGVAYWSLSDGSSQVGYSEGGIYQGDLSPSNTNGMKGVPEPSSFLLMGSGLVGLAGILKRKLMA